MPPKFVLHVLIAKGFEVWGQRPVQQQDAPIQGPDTRDVRGRHSAAHGDPTPRLRRGAARARSAQKPCVEAPELGRKRARDLPPLRSAQKSGPSGNRRRGGGGGGGGTPASHGLRGAWLSWSRASAATAQGLRPGPRGLPPEDLRGPAVTRQSHPITFYFNLPSFFPPHKGLRKSSSKLASSRKPSMVSSTHFRHFAALLRPARGIGVG